jgi:rhodanese-related sulfurtransferase
MVSLGRLRPEPWLDVTVLPDGVLELSSRLGDVRFHCGPAGTAMWIALCQHGWRIDAAADALADAWLADRENMRAELDIWVGELCDAGLLRQSSV